MSAFEYIKGYLISIHSPLTGRDNTQDGRRRAGKEFQSTLPSRGETIHGATMCMKSGISIHSPLTGRDPPPEKPQTIDAIISIHSPLTGRDRQKTRQEPYFTHFNPLSPHGERPNDVWRTHRKTPISIHSPLTGRDKPSCKHRNSHNPFQSTLPSRGETHSDQ